MRVFVRLFGLLLFIPPYAFAECVCESGAATDSSSCQVGYCIHPGKTADVVYYFHGAGSGLSNWTEPAYYPAQIRAFWQAQKIDPPTVISVSYGKTWLLASKNSSGVSGLFEDFETRMRPKIDASLAQMPARRLVMGESMGAFNSLQLSLRTANYAKAVVLCGVVSENIGPFSSNDEIVAMIKQSLAYQYIGEEGLDEMLARIRGALKLARDFYPSPDEWKYFDPLALAGSTQSKTEFYIASGLKDEFASYEGNEKLAEILRGRGLAVDWRPQWGGHCAIDIPSLARFLVE